MITLIVSIILGINWKSNDESVLGDNHQMVQNESGNDAILDEIKELIERKKDEKSKPFHYVHQSESNSFIVGDTSLLKHDSSLVFVPYENDPDIKDIFYKAVGKQDTFYYAIQNNGSIFLWAIVRGKGVKLLRDL